MKEGVPLCSVHLNEIREMKISFLFFYFLFLSSLSFLFNSIVGCWKRKRWPEGRLLCYNITTTTTDYWINLKFNGTNHSI